MYLPANSVCPGIPLGLEPPSRLCGVKVTQLLTLLPCLGLEENARIQCMSRLVSGYAPNWTPTAIGTLAWRTRQEPVCELLLSVRRSLVVHQSGLPRWDSFSMPFGKWRTVGIVGMMKEREAKVRIYSIFLKFNRE
jgi:hypothetical protein